MTKVVINHDAVPPTRTRTMRAHHCHSLTQNPSTFHPSRLPDSTIASASSSCQPTVPPIPSQHRLSSPAAAAALSHTSRAQAFSCKSPPSATTAARSMFAEPSLVSRSALGSLYVPHSPLSHHLLRLRYDPFIVASPGTGLWGKEGS